jgi:subtilase family protein
MSLKVLLSALVLVAVLSAALAGGAHSQSPPNRVRVFITLPDTHSAGDDSEIRSLGGETRHVFSSGRVISVEVPAVTVATLERNPRFVSIDPVPTVSIAEDTLPWGIDRVDAERVWGGAENAVNVVGGRNDGSGVNVAVIDTGIASHPDLNIIGGASFVDSEPSFSDGHGHGTHVAGTIAGRDNTPSSAEPSVIGMAPGAGLIAVKVMDSDGNGFMDDVAAGLTWAVQNGADVVNMSLVCNGSAAACNNSAMQTALQTATNAGVVMVAAAGNEGAGTNTVGWPAQDSRVIAVSATTTNDSIASFSSRGPAIDIAAPGVSIFSTYPGTYATFSGTSMASPHVAGAAALLVACGHSSSQVRSLLQSTADDLGAPGRDNDFGFGLLDIDQAATCGGGGDGDGDGSITEDFESGGFSGGSGWDAAWSRTGSTSYTTIMTSSTPQAGSWHARVRSNAAMSRRFSLAGLADASLTFWAKASSWESGDGAAVQVSTNGSSWTTVASFSNGFDTNVYQQRQVDLGAWAGAGMAYLRILGQMSASTDYFYVDSISISGDGGGGSPPPPPGGGGAITEGFESGDWSGGSGWAAAWTRAGSTSYSTILTSAGPQSGLNHVRVRYTASITRAFSLSGFGAPTLTFWAKASSWESNDGAAVQISANGSTWTTVAGFSDGFDINVYQQRQVNLSQWAGDSTVYIRILGQMSSSADYFYVDSITIQ